MVSPCERRVCDECFHSHTSFQWCVFGRAPLPSYSAYPFTFSPICLFVGPTLAYPALPGHSSTKTGCVGAAIVISSSGPSADFTVVSILLWDHHRLK
jgi:hypothetical protein